MLITYKRVIRRITTKDRELYRALNSTKEMACNHLNELAQRTYRM